MGFTARTTAPKQDNAKYFSDNPFYQAGYGMPNCTAYAYGRFWEILGSKPELSLGDAGEWYGHNDTYKRGQTAKLGAVCVWRSTVGGAGHVAIVEKIYSDGSILISESAWQGFYFRTTKLESDYTYFTGYDFLGFIYNPAVTEAEIPSSWIKGNRYLSESEMQNNALIVYDRLKKRGWSTNAIAGLLGNMESESTINPAIWQSLDSGNVDGGYGLVQWTPATNYTNWAYSKDYDITDGDRQLQWIDEETNGFGQWIQTDAYPIPFSTFKKSTKSPEYLASAFLKNFERAGVEVEEQRRTQARKWYNYLKDVNVDTENTEPDVEIPYIPRKKSKFNFLLFGQKGWKV